MLFAIAITLETVRKDVCTDRPLIYTSHCVFFSYYHPFKAHALCGKNSLTGDKISSLIQPKYAILIISDGSSMDDIFPVAAWRTSLMFTVEQVKSLNELELKVYQYIIQHKAAVPT